MEILNLNNFNLYFPEGVYRKLAQRTNNSRLLRIINEMDCILQERGFDTRNYLELKGQLILSNEKIVNHWKQEKILSDEELQKAENDSKEYYEKIYTLIKPIYDELILKGFDRKELIA
ncbi:MAG: hypothetical protein ACOYT4_04275 [Nanoarchaeota archaeon]